MNIRDIVNRDIVNLENCEQEPIHIPGSIQPHGFLLGLIGDDWKIDFCSANITEFIGKDAQAVLGRTFEWLFAEKATKDLQHYLKGNIKLSSPFRLHHNNTTFMCSVHFSESVMVFEAEPANDEDQTLPEIYEQTKEFLAYLTETNSLQHLCMSVAERIRQLTGYDRVMIYRFDEEYNGEVFAESLDASFEPFIGLHYPHTDIPAQARELYLKNLLRFITDVNYTPVPLYTIDDKNGKNLDLSLSVLRSTSPIHVRYLQNMGVGATLTISLIHKEKLWGLVACHHYSPKIISPSQRIAAMLQGQFITSQIDIRQANEQYAIAIGVNAALEEFLSAGFQPEYAFLQKISSNPRWLDICNAAGMCIFVNGQIYKGGITPGDEQLFELSKILSVKTGHANFQDSSLGLSFPALGIDTEHTAGILYYSLSNFNDDCIIWFRPGQEMEVNWGGDPEKAIVKDEKGLHPRKSFALWKKVVKGRSKPWLQPEINAAAGFSYGLQKNVALIYITQEEEKQRKLSLSLKQSNEELESINWISTHDLQEPLRKIQLFSSRVLDFDDAVSRNVINENVRKMNDSARRMQILLKDLLNHVRIADNRENFIAVDLKSLLSDVEGELEESIKEKNGDLKIGSLPEINGLAILLKQLFVNLITNALKFSDPERPQLITITCSQQLSSAPLEIPGIQLYHHILVEDTGIGFDNKFAESIFKIFTRLHGRAEYEGSGVGLALCKKIVQIHDGFITASGKKNQGATFHLYFPAR